MRFVQLTLENWPVAAGVLAGIVLLAVALWFLLHKRPSPEELEKLRRQMLVQSGRLVDGMLLDACEVEAEDGRTLTMLLYKYRIAGVDYECSQDVTGIGGVVDAEHVRAGFPCTVRYQPGNPQNSIVVSETWSGMRIGLPVLRSFEDPEPVDTSHLRGKRN